MRIWGGLPTTWPAAPPSGPGRHRAEPARRAEIPPPFPPGRAGRMRHRRPAGERAGPAAAGAGRGAAGRRAPTPATPPPRRGPAPPATSTSRLPSAPGGSPAMAAAGRRRRGRLARVDRPGRRPGRRDGLPARLVAGGYVGAVPPGPGRACWRAVAV